MSIITREEIIRLADIKTDLKSGRYGAGNTMKLLRKATADLTPGQTENFKPDHGASNADWFCAINLLLVRPSLEDIDNFFYDKNKNQIQVAKWIISLGEWTNEVIGNDLYLKLANAIHHYYANAKYTFFDEGRQLNAEYKLFLSNGLENKFNNQGLKVNFFFLDSQSESSVEDVLAERRVLLNQVYPVTRLIDSSFIEIHGTVTWTSSPNGDSFTVNAPFCNQKNKPVDYRCCTEGGKRDYIYSMLEYLKGISDSKDWPDEVNLIWI